MRAQVRLIDRNPAVVNAWKYRFEKLETRPEIACGDIFETSADALVLPGNSFGFLDRGLEMSVCERWGFQLQDSVRETVRQNFRGELLVGQATVLPLEAAGVDVASAGYRYLVYVAQSRNPSSIEGTLAAYLVARGAFMAIEGAEMSDDGASIASVVVPGIGTGNASLHPAVSARQVRYAYEVMTGLRGYGDKNLTQLDRRARKLSALPKSYLELEDGESPVRKP